MSFKTSIKGFIPPFVLWRVRPLKRNIKRFFDGRGEDWIVLTQGPLEGLEFFCSGLRREAIRLVASGKIDDYLFDYVKTAEPEGKVLFDVGAYLGYVTLGFAKLVGAEGKVLPLNLILEIGLGWNPNGTKTLQFKTGSALFRSPCQIEMARENLSILTVFLMEGLAGHF